MTDDEIRLKLADPEMRVRLTKTLEQWSRILGEMAVPGRMPTSGYFGIGRSVLPPKPAAPEVATVGEAPAWISRPDLLGSSRPR